MSLVDRAREETAEGLGVDISEVDWITDEYLSELLFESEEDPGTQGDADTPIAEVTCTPLHRSAPRYPLQFTRRYCYGYKVWMWSGNNTIWKGYHVTLTSTRVYYKEARG